MQKTVEEYIKDRWACRPNLPDMFLPTFQGALKVSYIRNPDTDPWVVTKEGNGGFEQSFCVHNGTVLYDSREEAEEAYRREQMIMDDIVKRLKERTTHE